MSKIWAFEIQTILCNCGRWRNFCYIDVGAKCFIQFMVVTALVTEKVITICHHHKGTNIKLSPVKCLYSAFFIKGSVSS